MCVFIWAVRLALRTVSALETVRNGLKDGYRFPTTPFFIRLERISCCQSSWPGFPVIGLDLWCCSTGTNPKSVDISVLFSISKNASIKNKNY